MTALRDAVVASAVRTPMGRAHKGGLKDTRPDTLASIAIKAALERVPGLNPEDVDDVILGCAMPEGEQGMNVARIASLLAGLPVSVPGVTVNRFCSSGLQTVADAAFKLMAGAADCAIAGGTESMSLVPMGGNKPSAHPDLLESMPEAYTPMGITAEHVARRFGISREAQDRFALQSHQRAVAAWKAGRFDAEIVPVHTHRLVGENGHVRAEPYVHERDDGPREGGTLSAMAQLKPAFDPSGSVTAGSSSPLTDGAAAAVLMSAEKAEALGVEPLGSFRDYQVVGVPPEIMGVGPLPAIQKLLQRNGLAVDDIDLYEINEAFAAQALYCIGELGLDPERVNVNGGAIALGHPLGCTGAKLLATGLHELKRRGGRYLVVSMCVGGGMGAAGLFERQG